jgi:NADP-dependent 3-hydroxy acid dehydrogenase YdfG
MRQVEGSTAVVTGATSGIGLAIVEAFVAEGMQVVMADEDEHRLGAEATRLGDEGADVHAVTVDVRDLASGEDGHVVNTASMARIGSPSASQVASSWV